jgi:MFS family permease
MTSSSTDHGVAVGAGDGADCSTDRQRAIGFLNGAHALDHFVILIYPTVVIELATVYGRSYSELIALGTASFTAFGLFSLPAGWLADRWSRRNMMVAFYLGSGLSLVAAAFSPSLTVLAAALFALGVFGAIYTRSAPRCFWKTRRCGAARWPSMRCAAISASRSPPASPRR